MKKFLPLFLSAALALSSCESTVESYDASKSNDVSFTSDINKRLTRVTGNSFDTSDEISVFAVEGSSIYADNVKYIYDDTKFSSATPISYESGDQSLAFSAVYPYSADYAGSTLSFAAQVNQAEASAYAGSDLLISHIDATSERTPKLSFDHKMAMINMTVKTDMSITSVASVIKAKTGVEYDVVANTVAPSGEVESVIPMTSGVNMDETSLIFEMSAIVAPQTIAAGEVFVSLNVDGVDYEWQVSSDFDLEPGHKYECEVTAVGSSAEALDVTFECGEIGDWSDGGDLDGGKEEPCTDFSSELVSVSNTDIVINVDKGSYKGNFFVGRTETMFYPGSPEQFATALINVENNHGTDLSVVDNKKVFSEGGEISLAKGWDIYANTEYYVIAFGIDDEGNIMTNIEEFKVTTDEFASAATIDFTIDSVSTKSIVLSTDPSDEIGNYTYGIIDLPYFENTLGGDVATTADLIASVYETYQEYGLMDFGVADGVFILNGPATFDVYEVWSIEKSTTYKVLVFGVDAEGKVNTGISIQECTTPASDEPQADTSAWYGTWTLTSASSQVDGGPLSVDVIIKEGANSADVDVYGWDISANRWVIPMPASVNADGNLEFATETFMGTADSGDIYFRSLGFVGGSYQGYYFINGGFAAMTASLASDGQSASAVGAEGTITDGAPFTITTMLMTLKDTSGAVYSFYTDEALGFDQVEKLVGPYTLTKKSDDTTVPSAAPATKVLANIDVVDAAIIKALEGRSFKKAAIR